MERASSGGDRQRIADRMLCGFRALRIQTASMDPSLPALWQRKKIVSPETVRKRLEEVSSAAVVPREYIGPVPSGIYDIRDIGLVLQPIVNLDS